MTKTIIVFLAVMLIINLVSRNVSAAEYALAMPTFLNYKCSVIIWIHNKNESKRIIYPGDFNDQLCHVEIPVPVFQKHFKYCVLAGIRVSDNEKSYLAEFGGGPAGDREIYWFEWRDPQKVFPTFYCILNKLQR